MLRFKLHHLCAFSLLVTTLCARPAQAIGVNFDLAENDLALKPAVPGKSSSNGAIQTFQAAQKTAIVRTTHALPIPPEARQPPTRVRPSAGALPHNVIASARILEPPPVAAFPSARVLHPDSSPSIHDTPLATKIAQKPIGLSFTPTQRVVKLAMSQTPTSQTLPTRQSELPKWIYEGGSNSLVARVIGRAEGTRAASGQPTRAYYGHTDPGNGVWNIGTFSYQHGAHSPEEADRKQLQRLTRQGKQISHQATQAKLNMSLGEILNGLDLANQSPRAALEPGGYVDRLVQAKRQGMKHDEAIVWARTYAYLEPETQRWNAPGLGNTLPSIRQDQNRRHEAVIQAFDHYRAQRDTASVPETLADPALTVVAQQPAASDSSPSKDLKILTQTSKSIQFQQSQPHPLDFSVAEHLISHDRELSHQRQDQLPPTPLSPTPEFFGTTDDTSAAANGSSVQLIPETESLQIQS